MTGHFLKIILWLLLGTCAAVAASGPALYHDFQGLTAALQDLADKYPKLVKLDNLGTTQGRRTLWVVTLAAGNVEARPAVLVVAGVDAVDLTGSELTLAFIQTMAAQYGQVDSVTRLLERTTFYLFPRVNPDASEAFFQTPKTERRGNLRPLDSDADGAVDEDGVEDLNGDGLITQMRVTDPAGEWLEDKDLPQLLRKADPSRGEKGRYRLLSEGRDNDRDGNWNEDGLGGVDFNRNFTYDYIFFQPESGPHQISEIESRAVADFAFAHPNIAVVFSFSPNHNLIQPWKAQEKPQADRSRRSGRQWREPEPIRSVLSEDATYYKQLAAKFKELSQLTDAPEALKGQGALSEWAYFHFGRWSLSTPSWWPAPVKEKADSSQKKPEGPDEKKKASVPGQKKEEKDPLAAQRQLWHWLQQSGQSDKFVNWREFVHPDFPNQKVEIGGFVPFVAQNPPSDSLRPQAQKFTGFLLHLGTLLPTLQLTSPQVTRLAENVYRIQIYLVNEGFLPTHTQLGSRNDWCRKVKVSLQLDKSQKLASGRTVQIIERLDGSGSARELSWVVLARLGSQLVIEAGSPLAGSDRKVIALQ